MKKLWVIGLLTIGGLGCKRTDNPYRPVNVISDGDVSLTGHPQADIVGNIEFTPVLFKFDYPNIKVFIKASPNSLWEEITEAKKDVPTYVNDRFAKQLRFQNCKEGMGYAIKIL